MVEISERHLHPPQPEPLVRKPCPIYCRRLMSIAAMCSGLRGVQPHAERRKHRPLKQGSQAQVAMPGPRQQADDMLFTDKEQLPFQGHACCAVDAPGDPGAQRRAWQSIRRRRPSPRKPRGSSALPAQPCLARPLRRLARAPSSRA